jgi:hypothetical protein
VGLLVGLAVISVDAAAREYLRMGRQETLPALGIKFRGLKDAKAMPLASMTALQLKRSDGAQIEAYSLRELWFNEQCLGRWGSDVGMLTLARMTLPVPDSVPVLFKQDKDALVAREAYDDWRRQQAADAELAPDQQHRWLESFVGTKLQPQPETLKREGPPKVVTLFYRKPETEAQDCWVYVVSPVADPKNQLVFIYQASAAADAEKSARGVLQSLSSLVFYQPTKKESVPAATEKSTRRTVKRDDWSPEYVASREKVIKNIGNLKDWWYLPTDNFILVANLKNRKTIQVIEENLEISRSMFTDFYPVKRPLNAVSVCRVFQERDEYITYVGAEFQWSGGLWDSSRKELVVSPTGWGSAKEQRKMLVDVVYHEGFHQYIYYVTGEVQNLVWFNEGNATFFEGVDLKTRGKYEITVVPHYYRVVKALAEGGGLPSARLFLDMSHQAFLSRGREQNYAMVWALVYFLRKGCREIEKEAEYGAILSRYYDAVVEFQDSAKATEVAWAGVDMAAFDTDFAAFWESQRSVKRSSQAEPVKYLASEPSAQAPPAP